MCAFRLPQPDAPAAAVPVFTTRGFGTASSFTPAQLSGAAHPITANPFSFFNATQNVPHSVGESQSDVLDDSPLTEDSCTPPERFDDVPELIATELKQKEAPHSASRSSPLSGSLSSFAISSASEHTRSVTSTQPASPVPKVNIGHRSFLLQVVPETANKTSKVDVAAAEKPVAALLLNETCDGAKALFRRLANKADTDADVHADEVMDLYLSPSAPWFNAGVVVVALCLVNRYTARFPHWYCTNLGAVENDETRRRTPVMGSQDGDEADRCGQAVSKQNAARTLLAALQAAAKLYADTTYKNESLCRVWENARTARAAAEPRSVKSSSMCTKLTPSRLATSEWRLMEELGYSAWVEAEEYNTCLQAIADLA